MIKFVSSIFLFANLELGSYLSNTITFFQTITKTRRNNKIEIEKCYTLLKWCYNNIGVSLVLKLVHRANITIEHQ